jgi:hypothetical protein
MQAVIKGTVWPDRIVSRARYHWRGLGFRLSTLRTKTFIFINFDPEFFKVKALNTQIYHIVKGFRDGRNEILVPH